MDTRVSEQQGEQRWSLRWNSITSKGFAVTGIKGRLARRRNYRTTSKCDGTPAVVEETPFVEICRRTAVGVRTIPGIITLWMLVLRAIKDGITAVRESGWILDRRNSRGYSKVCRKSQTGSIFIDLPNYVRATIIRMIVPFNARLCRTLLCSYNVKKHFCF